MARQLSISLVGALFGVFKGLYAESEADTAVDDYVLATARLLTLPAVSGLAGLTGRLDLDGREVVDVWGVTEKGIRL